MSYKSKYRWVHDGNKMQGVPAHIAIARKVLGKDLPAKAEVHHIDGDGHNNNHSNLVICPNHAYHMILHIRTKALESCGNPNWLRCIRCHKWDDPANMSAYIPKDQTSPRAEHRACNAAYKRNKRAQNALAR